MAELNPFVARNFLSVTETVSTWALMACLKDWFPCAPSGLFETIYGSRVDADG